MEQLTQTENILKSLEDGGRFSTATTTKPLIQRVTHLLLRDNMDFERYFKPTSVALGPLHHDYSPDSKLQRGEKSKLQMAAEFIKYSGTTKELFYSFVMAELNSLKECYDSKQIGTWSDEYLACMFLVDGCAVLFFIDHDATENLKELGVKDDLLAYLKLDLFLLENQLPYRLLQILIDHCTRVPRCNPPNEKYKDKSPAEVLKASITNFINKNAMSLFGQEQPKHLIKSSKQQQQQQEQQTAAAATTTTAIPIDTQQDKPAHLLELLWRRLTKLKKDKESDGTMSNCISSNSNPGDKNTHCRPTFRSVKELKKRGFGLKLASQAVLRTLIPKNIS